MIERNQIAGMIAAFDRANLLIVSEGMVNTWWAALRDLDPQELEEAGMRILRTRTSTERFLTPGDLRAAVAPSRSAWDRARNVSQERREISGGN